MPQWKQYSGTWPLQTQMQAIADENWTGRPLNSLYAWGQNAYGNLGTNDKTYKSSPTQIGSLTTWATAANTRGQLFIATQTDGTLWTCGYNGYGELAQGNIVNRSSPTQVGALTNWLKVSGSSNSGFAIKTGGTLWSWGNNDYGEIGQNTGAGARLSSPVQIGALSDWSLVANGHYSSFAIKTNGTLWAWGRNNFGQLGVNDGVNKSSPIQVGSGTTWLDVTSGQYFSGAVKTDGTLWTWGRNNVGQLGNDNSVTTSSPAQVGALTNWSRVSCGSQHALALKTDGTIWTWGGNVYGQLGLNDSTNYTNRSSPVQIGSLTTWSKVNAGKNYYSLAIKTDGTLWSWGYNTYGQLGLGDVDARSSPVQVGALNKWYSISLSENGVLAIYQTTT